MFSSDEMRVCETTAYARQQGKGEVDLYPPECWWFLQSYGYYITYDGDACNPYNTDPTDKYGVRPIVVLRVLGAE